jgi:hypothetical protein
MPATQATSCSPHAHQLQWAHFEAQVRSADALSIPSTITIHKLSCRLVGDDEPIERTPIKAQQVRYGAISSDITTPITTRRRILVASQADQTSTWPTKFKIMSWNIKDLSLSGKRTDESMRLLSETIDAVRPTILFVQEVKTSEGGKRAITDIVTMLQKLHPPSDYQMELSDRISLTSDGNKRNGNDERYAVIWSAAELGHDVKPKLELWRSHKHDPPFGIGSADLLTGARTAWSQQSSGEFDRAPLFVRFGDDRRATVFCNVHHARHEGEKFPAPGGKIAAEAVMLQAAMGGFAQVGISAVLCGDLNISEGGYHSKRVWQPDKKGVPDWWPGGSAVKLSRAHFFDAFERAFPQTESTNLYEPPESDMHGLVAAPAHNDNIWTSGFEVSNPKVGKIPKGVKEAVLKHKRDAALRIGVETRTNRR